MNVDTLTLITIAIAICVALLAWFLIDLSINGIEKYRTQFTDRTNFQLREFFLFIDPRKLFFINISIIILGSLTVWILTEKIILGIFVAIVLALMPRLIYAWMRNRRMQKFESQLPDSLMMISGGLRAGLGLSSALQQIVAETPAPLGQEFTLLLREQRLGLTLEQSLNNLARRMPTQTTSLVVSAMRVANETGGGLAETLERTSGTIRSRLQMEGKIKALTAQGKLQGWVVGLLPIALMLALNQLEPEAMAVLWHTKAGWIALGAIAFLECMGIYLIRKIVSIDV